MGVSILPCERSRLIISRDASINLAKKNFANIHSSGVEIVLGVAENCGSLNLSSITISEKAKMN